MSRKREEKCEKGVAANPGYRRGGHVPKVPPSPPPMDLRLKEREEEGFSSWENTIGRACPKCPPPWMPSRRKEEETWRVEQVLPPQ